MIKLMLTSFTKETVVHVFMAGRLPQAAFNRLENERGLTVQVIDAPDTKEMAAGLKDADVLLLRATPILTAQHIANAGKLKVVSRYGVGYDNVDVPALTKAGIPLMVVGDTNSTSVAEGAFSLLLAAARQSIHYDQAVRSGDWRFRDSFNAVEISRKNLLVIGFGRIGRKMTKMALAFDMEVLVHDPFVSNDSIVSEGCTPVSDLGSALAVSDFISLHLALSRTTTHLLNNDLLRKIKPGAIIVNTSRGGLIDEHALASHLRSGLIKAAGIDVFSQEPIHKDNVLLGYPNVILSPHAAGLTKEAADRMAIACVENALRAIAGNMDVTCLVNPDSVDV
jgi:D-3-phosphoglycerate dehydrogenase